MSGMSPSIQAWSVNTSIMQLRAMMSHLTITDDHIRRYIVSPDEGRRMDEARQNRVSPSSSAPGPVALAEAEAQTTKPKKPQRAVNDNSVVEVRFLFVPKLIRLRSLGGLNAHARTHARYLETSNASR